MDTIFRVIQGIMQDNVQKVHGIKTVYNGDPGLIAEKLLPAITIYPTNSNLNARSIGSTGIDTVVHSIGISIIYDMRSGFSKSPEEFTLQLTLFKTIFERDTSGNLKDDCVIGALRTYANMNIQDEVEFMDNFDITWGTNDTRGYPTLEAAITFDATILLSRPA